MSNFRNYKRLTLNKFSIAYENINRKMMFPRWHSQEDMQQETERFETELRERQPPKLGVRKMKVGTYCEFDLKTKRVTVFYEIDPEKNGGDCETVAWAQYKTFRNKGWTKRMPARYGRFDDEVPEDIDEIHQSLINRGHAFADEFDEDLPDYLRPD